MDRAIAISDETAIVTNGSDDDLIKYFEFGNEELVIADNFDELCKGDVYQIMCSCKIEEHRKILNSTSRTKITAWWDKAYDIIPNDSGKGNAVNKVLEYYSFKKRGKYCLW